MACPRLLTALILATAFPVDGALAQMPPAIAAPGEDIVATFHAEGAQIYQCKPGNEGKLARPAPFAAFPIQQITFSSARTNNPLSGVPGNLRGAAMQAVDALRPLRGWMP
jgi:hypothetical protein